MPNYNGCDVKMASFRQFAALLGAAAVTIGAAVSAAVAYGSGADGHQSVDPTRVSAESATEQAEQTANPGLGAASSCIEFDEAGERTWYNDFTDQAVQMGDAISVIAGEHPSEVAGASFCSNRQGLAVFLKPEAVEVEQLLVEAAAEYPEMTLEFQHVPRSLDEMEALVQEVVAVGFEQLGLQELGPDIYTGGLLLGVSADGSKDEKAAAAATAEAAVKAIVGDDVPLAITLVAGEIVAAYNRYDDDVSP